MTQLYYARMAQLQRNFKHFCLSSSIFSKHDPAIDLDGDFHSVYQASIELHVHVTDCVNQIPFEGQVVCSRTSP